MALLHNDFAHRDLLPLDQSYLWQIKAGIVRALTWQEDGALVTLGLWGPGDVVGRPLTKADPYQIECLTNVKASKLPADKFHQATDAMIAHIHCTKELLEILHSKQAHSSLLRLLAWLAKRFGRKVEQGQLIEPRLTHQEIAELIGSTRVTITRLLNEFEKRGMIHRTRRRLIVLHEQSF